jgi:transketolase
MQSDLIRGRILEVARASHCGHVSSSLSCVELIAGALRFCEGSPRSVFILSKGHAGLGLYAALSLKDPELSGALDQYGTDGSILCSHLCYDPARGIMASSGSLGVGLAIGVGYALAYQLLGPDRKVIVLVGDGELDEGVVWESLRVVQHRKLRNIALLLDHNGLRACGPSLPVTGRLFEGFGFAVREIDGHDPAQIDAALAGLAAGPVCVLARTIKGKGLDGLEGTVRSHYWRAP